MKRTSKVHPLEKEQMRAMRLEMGLNLRELAAVMDIPYRTLQNYEGGQRAIPPEFADLLRVEQKKQQRIRAEVFAGIDARIAAEVPYGIRSEVVLEDE